MTCVVVSAMNALDRKSTIGQTIVAVTHFVHVVKFLIASGFNMLDGLREMFVSAFLNCKEIGIFVLCVIGFFVVLMIAVLYTKNEYNIKERLADILKPSLKTAVLEL